MMYDKITECVYPYKRDCKGCKYSAMPEVWDGGCMLADIYYRQLTALERAGHGKRARAYWEAFIDAEEGVRKKDLYRLYKRALKDGIARCEGEGVDIFLQDMKRDTDRQPRTNNRKNQRGNIPIYLL